MLKLTGYPEASSAAAEPAAAAAAASPLGRVKCVGDGHRGLGFGQLHPDRGRGRLRPARSCSSCRGRRAANSRAPQERGGVAGGRNDRRQEHEESRCLAHLCKLWVALPVFFDGKMHKSMLGKRSRSAPRGLLDAASLEYFRLRLGGLRIGGSVGNLSLLLRDARSITQLRGSRDSGVSHTHERVSREKGGRVSVETKNIINHFKLKAKTPDPRALKVI